VVLLIASVLTIPGHTLTSLRWSLVGCLAVGVIFLAIGMRSMLRPRSYKPVLEDWIFHSVLPSVAYLALMTSVFLLSAHSWAGLYAIAGVVILLLFIGIHNAWDAAMWIALDRPRQQGTDAVSPAPPASPPPQPKPEVA